MSSLQLKEPQPQEMWIFPTFPGVFTTKTKTWNSILKIGFSTFVDTTSFFRAANSPKFVKNSRHGWSGSKDWNQLKEFVRSSPTYNYNCPSVSINTDCWYFSSMYPILVEKERRGSMNFHWRSITLRSICASVHLTSQRGEGMEQTQHIALLYLFNFYDLYFAFNCNC